jgi:hypothetical protein
LFFNDLNGDEDYHLFAADADAGEIRHLTPFEKVPATLLCFSRDLAGSRGGWPERPRSEMMRGRSILRPASEHCCSRTATATALLRSITRAGYGWRHVRPLTAVARRYSHRGVLARHLGGRLEPIGDNFEGSSHQIRAGGAFLAAR